MTERTLSTATVLKAIKSFTPVLMAIVGFDIIASAQSLSLVGCSGACTVNNSPDPRALDSTGGQFAQVQQSVDGGSFQITVAGVPAGGTASIVQFSVFTNPNTWLIITAQERDDANQLIVFVRGAPSGETSRAAKIQITPFGYISVSQNNLNLAGNFGYCGVLRDYWPTPTSQTAGPAAGLTGWTTDSNVVCNAILAAYHRLTSPSDISVITTSPWLILGAVTETITYGMYVPMTTMSGTDTRTAVVYVTNRYDQSFLEYTYVQITSVRLTKTSPSASAFLCEG